MRLHALAGKEKDKKKENDKENDKEREKNQIKLLNQKENIMDIIVKMALDIIMKFLGIIL